MRQLPQVMILFYTFFSLEMRVQKKMMNSDKQIKLENKEWDIEVSYT